jgi:molybdate transport system permease protein
MTPPVTTPPATSATPQVGTPSTRWLNYSNGSFHALLALVVAAYVAMLLALVGVDGYYLASSPAAGAEADTKNPFAQAFADPAIRHSIRLTLVSCSMAAILSLLVAVPIGYALTHFRFLGKQLIESIIDIPIVLPPLVVGISLLILFQYLPVTFREHIVYEVPGVVLAQFVVASAFAVQTMRNTFRQIDRRREQVAQTLGCSRWQAVGWVTLAEARGGMVTALTMAWARSLGEFGPLLVFAGATRGKTEVLSTTVFLELSIGNLRGAVAVSLLMIALAAVVLTSARLAATSSRTKDEG